MQCGESPEPQGWLVLCQLSWPAVFTLAFITISGSAIQRNLLKAYFILKVLKSFYYVLKILHISL